MQSQDLLLANALYNQEKSHRLELEQQIIQERELRREAGRQQLLDLSKIRELEARLHEELVLRQAYDEELKKAKKKTMALEAQLLHFVHTQRAFLGDFAGAVGEIMHSNGKNNHYNLLNATSSGNNVYNSSSSSSSSGGVGGRQMSLSEQMLQLQNKPRTHLRGNKRPREALMEAAASASAALLERGSRTYNDEFEEADIVEEEAMGEDDDMDLDGDGDYGGGGGRGSKYLDDDDEDYDDDEYGGGGRGRKGAAKRRQQQQLYHRPFSSLSSSSAGGMRRINPNIGGFPPRRSYDGQSNAVDAVSEQGIVLASYPSFNVAEKMVEIQKGSISQVIKGNKSSAGGFYWRSSARGQPIKLLNKSELMLAKQQLESDPHAMSSSSSMSFGGGAGGRVSFGNVDEGMFGGGGGGGGRGGYYGGGGYEHQGGDGEYDDDDDPYQEDEYDSDEYDGREKGGKSGRGRGGGGGGGGAGRGAGGGRKITKNAQEAVGVVLKSDGEFSSEFKNSKEAKRVECLGFDGSVIACYISFSEASRLTGVHRGTISSVCFGKKPNSGGFNWRISMEPNMTAKSLTRDELNAALLNTADATNGGRYAITSQKQPKKSSSTTPAFASHSFPPPDQQQTNSQGAEAGGGSDQMVGRHVLLLEGEYMNRVGIITASVNDGCYPVTLVPLQSESETIYSTISANKIRLMPTKESWEFAMLIYEASLVKQAQPNNSSSAATTGAQTITEGDE